MGLFSEKSCPLEDNYLKVYGIPAPQKWKPEDCPECQYQENNKCQYKKVLATAGTVPQTRSTRFNQKDQHVQPAGSQEKGRG